jgi:hypothetical protein
LLSLATKAFGATFSTTVFNGSKKAVLPDYPVTVRITEKNNGRSQQTYSEQQGRTDSQGVFEGEITAPAGKIIIAEINYRGISYFSKPVITENKRRHYDLAVQGYEITSSHAEVGVPSRTMLITPKDEQTLEVYDSMQVINRGNSTYVGSFNDELDLSQVLHIPVPESYRLRGFQVSGQSPRIRTLGKAIVSQNAIKPGISQISMRYLVVSDIGFFNLSLFSQKDTPEVQEMNLYFPAASKWRVKPANLKPADQETLGNTTYQIWKGRPGSVLRLKTYSPAYIGGFNFWHVSIILAFLVAGSCLLLARKKINHWYLIQEEKKLKKLQNLIIRETDDQELAEYYQPFKLILDSRLQETKHITQGG